MVIGAAVLLFIASFLDIYSADDAPDSVDFPNAWESGPILMSVVLSGIIGAVLIVVARGLPQPRKVAGLDLGQFGVAATVFAAWGALANIFDPFSGVNNLGGSSDSGVDAGIGLILALIATLVMAAAAVATPLVPALKAGPRRCAASAAAAAVRRAAAGWLRVPGRPAARPRPAVRCPARPARPGPALRRSAAAGRRSGAAAAVAGRAAGCGGLLAVLVRRAGAAPAVRGGRLAVADRRTGARHLVLGRRAARSRPGRQTQGGRRGVLRTPPASSAADAPAEPQRPLARLPGEGRFRVQSLGETDLTHRQLTWRARMRLGSRTRLLRGEPGPPPTGARRGGVGLRLGLTAESWGSDAFTPLTWFAAHTSRIRLGTAIAQMAALLPTTTAMHALTLDHLSGGRMMLGLGLCPGRRSSRAGTGGRSRSRR